MNCILTKMEFERLQGLPALSWPVYCSLRQHMDVNTGYVGEKIAISMRTICNACYVEPRQGRAGTGSPSISQVRTVLKNLIEEGLVETHSPLTANLKLLILSLPIALIAHNQLVKEIGPNAQGKNSHENVF